MIETARPWTRNSSCLEEFPDEDYEHVRPVYNVHKSFLIFINFEILLA